MHGVLVEINNVNYTDKAGKPAVLPLAVLQVGDFEESIVISPAKAEEIKDCIEQEFNINIKRVVMYTKDGAPRQALSFTLGVKIKSKAK
jgi:hypothetical protein